VIRSQLPKLGAQLKDDRPHQLQAEFPTRHERTEQISMELHRGECASTAGVDAFLEQALPKLGMQQTPSPRTGNRAPFQLVVGDWATWHRVMKLIAEQPLTYRHIYVVLGGLHECFHESQAINRIFWAPLR
jgi:hypothetical protein